MDGSTLHVTTMPPLLFREEANTLMIARGCLSKKETQETISVTQTLKIPHEHLFNFLHCTYKIKHAWACNYSGTLPISCPIKKNFYSFQSSHHGFPVKRLDTKTSDRKYIHPGRCRRDSCWCVSEGKHHANSSWAWQNHTEKSEACYNHKNDEKSMSS